MCGKQADQRLTMHNFVACWWFKKFSLRQESDDQNNRKIKEKYGAKVPLTIEQGKLHTYLGMDLDFCIQGQVKILMFDYIKEAIEEADKIVRKGYRPTPAIKDLFTVGEEQSILLQDKVEKLHWVIAKFLFISKRARPDLQTTVAYLPIRVHSPPRQIQKKCHGVLTIYVILSSTTSSFYLDHIMWSSGILTVNLKFTQMWGAILVEWWLLDKEQSTIPCRNRGSIPEVRPKPSLWLSMTLWQRFSGQNDSWRDKDTKSKTTSFSKTIRLPCS